MLHIGVSSVPSLYLLPELLAAYHEGPGNRFRTSRSDSLDVINKVADSTCDIGLVGTKTAEANCDFCRSPWTSWLSQHRTHRISVPIKASRTR